MSCCLLFIKCILFCLFIQKISESLEGKFLSRAQSIRVDSLKSEEGLKRVFSAPQLRTQEKGSLLKRKLSLSDVENHVVDRANIKHKKQGLLYYFSTSILFFFIFIILV